MHSTPCIETRFARVLGMLQHLLPVVDADVLLDARGRLVLGVTPAEELVADRSTSRVAWRNFCFADDRPVLGYASYELGMHLCGVTSARAAGFPLAHLKKYRHYIEFDGSRLTYRGDNPHFFDDTLDLLCDPQPPGCAPRMFDATQSLDEAAYMEAVGRALGAIRSGHVYQTTLSIAFGARMECLFPERFFLDLFATHPARFYALFHTTGQRTIISAAPERFLQVLDGHVLTQPIKGTAVFAGPQPTQAEINALTSSPKERAELAMIVDLLRNDISTTCAYGSVRVEDFPSVFAVDNLLQMYASVYGKLAGGKDVIDLLFDCLPPGSVTGVPKKRALVLIDQLERHSRRAYCGSVFCIRSPWVMDSSVAIRTAVADGEGNLHFYAGSGITVKSDPAAEYRETMAKAQKFLDLLQT